VILSGGVGYKPRRKGEKKRKLVRGNTVSMETTFLNFVVVEGEEPQEKAASEE